MRLFTLILTTLCFALGALPAMAKCDYKFSGRLMVQHNGKKVPLRNVKVRVKRRGGTGAGRKHVTTDSKGRFSGAWRFDRDRNGKLPGRKKIRFAVQVQFRDGGGMVKVARGGWGGTPWDTFKKVEALVQGDRNKRMRLEKQPWNAEKITKKGITVAIWTAIAFWTGFTFTAYWADAPQLFVDFFTLDAAKAAYITTGILTLTTLIAAGFAREQVCIYMCPYARFQSVMFDKETLLVSYDAKRGEGEAGRQPLKQGLMTLDERHAQGVGDCIDCKLCVQVCPTGIDIRDGLQLECISCGLCIDACDQIMTKRGWPTGLIRYASEQELETGEKPNLLKFRTIGYGVATLAATVLLLYGIFARAPADLSVQQVRQPLFTVLASGDIQNNYNVKINNKLQEPLDFSLALEGLPDAKVSVVGDFEGLSVPADGSRKYLVHVRAPRDAEVDRRKIEFILTEENGRIEPLEHDATFVFR